MWSGQRSGYPLAVNPVTNLIYVVNSAVGDPTGTVSVIDGETSVVVATVPVGHHPRCVAVDPETNRLYVTHYFSRTVSVIDGATLRIVAVLPVRGNPLGIDIDPHLGRIYIASMADTSQGGTFAGVSVIDAATHDLCGLVPVGYQVPSACGPMCVRVNSCTDLVYVGGQNPPAVSVIDGGRNCVVQSFGFEGPVFDIGVNRHTHRVYIADHTTGDLSVIDGDSHSVTATVGGFHSPTGVSVNAGADRVYVCQVGAVSVLTGRTARTIGLIPLPGTCSIATGQLGGFQVNPNTDRLYISHQQSGLVFVVEDGARSREEAGPMDTEFDAGSPGLS